MIRRHAPADGLRVWAQPDPNAAPFATVPPGHELELIEENALGWARVRIGPGQEGWVDGRQLVVPGGGETGAPAPPGSGPWRWVVAAVVGVLAIGGAIVGYLATQDDDANIVATRAADAPAGSDTGETEPPAEDTGSGEEPEPPEESEEPGETEPPGDTEEPEPEGPTSAGSFDFSDALLEQALADGAANPLGEGSLPARDEVATARLVSGLTESGFDLSGLQLTVYRGGTAPSFLLMESDDSAAIVNDDAGAETFVPELLASPGVADVDRLVMQHSSSDDQGPFVVTLSLRMDDLREAAETGADVFDRIAVQVDR